jgi:Ca2+-binding EF-hand superfamily protein
MFQSAAHNIDPRWALTKWGDKFSAAEVDDIFGEFEIDDDGFLDGKAMCSLFVAGGILA